jgi:2'-5' RNA ligase
MPETLRGFIAINVPASPSLKDVLRTLAGLGRAVRPVAPDNLHLTLKFLGEISASQAKDVGRALHTVCCSCAPVAASLCGLGVFPHPDRPQVVWAGIDPPEPLVALARQIEEALETCGFPREERPFVPHVTIARIKARPPDTLRKLVLDHEATFFGPLRVSEVRLIQSVLGRDGPQYAPLDRAPLAG